MKRLNESGSAILWVLVGVALFAALGFAFMSSSHTSTSMLTNEAARSYAHQIASYGNDLKQAVRRLMLRGCAETQISFENTVYKQTNGTPIQTTGHNPLAPANKSCDIFVGGQMTPLVLSEAATHVVPGNTWNPGAMALMLRDMVGVGEDGQLDLLLLIGEVDREVCIQFNNIMGVTNPDGEPPQETDNDPAGRLFAGVYATTAALIGDDAPELAGHGASCYQRWDTHPATDGTYLLNFTLLPR